MYGVLNLIRRRYQSRLLPRSVNKTRFSRVFHLTCLSHPTRFKSSPSHANKESFSERNREHVVSSYGSHLSMDGCLLHLTFIFTFKALFWLDQQSLQSSLIVSSSVTFSGFLHRLIRWLHTSHALSLWSRL